MKQILSLLSAVVLSVCTFSPASASTGFAMYPDSPELTTTFSVSASTKVPGKVLKAGSYSIRVVDHLSDRVVLQIEDAKGKSETRFLAVPNALLAHGSGIGPISYGEVKHSDDSLRGFAFPGGSVVEFVYPKEEAAGIAKASGGSVLAIDPASEGRPNPGKLSKDDLQMVTLWTLSPTRVGPNDSSQPAIQAQRYQVKQTASPRTTQVASLEESTNPAPERTLNSVRAPRQPIEQSPVERHATKRTLVLKSLPHTASSLPLILLAGFGLLVAAAFLRMFRVAFDA